MSWLSKITGGGSKATITIGGKETPRPTEPPKIHIDRHEYTPEEFVLGSFRVRPYEGDLIARQQFDFRISFKLGEDAVEFICRGLVVKQNAEAGLVARYSRPQPFYEKKLIDYMKAWKSV